MDNVQRSVCEGSNDRAIAVRIAPPISGEEMEEGRLLLSSKKYFWYRLSCYMTYVISTQ